MDVNGSDWITLFPYPQPHFFSRIRSGSNYDRIRIRMQIISDYGFEAETDWTRIGNEFIGLLCTNRIIFAMIKMCEYIFYSSALH